VGTGAGDAYFHPGRPFHTPSSLPHVLRADSHSNHTGRNPAHKREARQEFDRKGKNQSIRTATSEHAVDDAILNKQLHPLGEAGRQHAPLLHAAQVFDGYPPFTQRRRQQIRGSHRVLDGEVDADTAHRRHSVRRIADAQKAGTVPLRQPVNFDGEQLDRIPILKFADTVSSKGRQLCDAVTERRQPLFPNLLS
jgi:hypothetical protein